jgi:hypothetical protein
MSREPKTDRGRCGADGLSGETGGSQHATRCSASADWCGRQHRAIVGSLEEAKSQPANSRSPPDADRRHVGRKGRKAHQSDSHQRQTGAGQNGCGESIGQPARYWRTNADGEGLWCHQQSGFDLAPV